MNPYAFRGWLPNAYADSTSCDRNFPVYGSWPSGYFAPSSVYSLPSETPKQHANTTDWKIQSIYPHAMEHPTVPKDGAGTGSGAVVGGPASAAVTPVSHIKSYDTVMYKGSPGNGLTGGTGTLGTGPTGVTGTTPKVDVDGGATKDDSQRSCCVLSCSCNNQQRINNYDTPWRGADGSAGVELPGSKNGAVPPYQTFCQRGKFFYLHAFLFGPAFLSCYIHNVSPVELFRCASSLFSNVFGILSKTLYSINVSEMFVFRLPCFREIFVSVNNTHSHILSRILSSI